MEKIISKELKSDLNKLGLYQVIGGAVGVLITLWSIFQSPMIGLTILIYLFILLFFAYSIFCGTFCLKTKKNALEYSLANQLFQMIGFAIMGFAFKYVAGFYLTIGLDLTDSVKFDFSAGISKFDFNINNEKDRLEVNLNLIAFALIYWIDNIMKKAKEEETIKQTSSIGDT